MFSREQIAVLIAPRGSGRLTPALVAAAAAQILTASQPARWLSSGEAAEIPFDAAGDDRASVAQAIRGALGPEPIDIGIVPAHGRRKRLLVADMDSTLIGQECIDELAARAGVGAQVAAITEKSMQGELDFEQSLTERVRLLAGLSETVLADVMTTRISLNSGAEAVAGTMRRSGALTVIVSGGFAPFTSYVRSRAGFDRDLSNRLEVSGGKLTGRLIPPILGRDAKREALVSLTAELAIGPQDSLAVGDGANDIDMIRVAGLGVAYHAKPSLRRVADVCIDHADLTALLYLQGFRGDEIDTDPKVGRRD